MALIGVIWIVYGYSMAFGNDLGGGLLGDPTSYFGLTGLMSEKSLVGTLPSLAFVAFQAVFAVITVALISGAIADRARFGPWLLFAGVWATVVYFPVAHWVFAFDDTTGPGFAGGWIANKLKAIDFAGQRDGLRLRLPLGWGDPRGGPARNMAVTGAAETSP